MTRTPLLATVRPPVPPEHPMAEYAAYVIGRTTDIYFLLWVVLVLLLGLVAAVLLLSLQKYWGRKEDRKRRLSMDAAVAALRSMTAINDVLKARVERQIESAARDLKAEVRNIPTPTADKVVQLMEEKKAGESGIGKGPTSPPPANPSKGE